LVLGTSGSNGSSARPDGGDLTNTTVSKDAHPTQLMFSCPSKFSTFHRSFFEYDA
jgi:hypothetical protein